MNDETFHVGTPPTLPAQPVKRVGGPSALILSLIGAGLLLLGCCTGFGIGSAGEPEPKTVTLSSPSPVIQYLPAPSTAAQTSAAPAPAPTKAATATIEPGIWTVGEDIAAGTYKLREAHMGTCYWTIYKTGTNQSDIVEIDIVTGGRPSVTLKRGHDFDSDCGTWVRTK